MPLDKNIKQINGKSVSASYYYYGCEASTWDEMKYWEAIEDRHTRAYALFKVLYKEDIALGLGTSLSDECALRLRKVGIAVKDTKQLLDERTLVM